MVAYRRRRILGRGRHTRGTRSRDIRRLCSDQEWQATNLRFGIAEDFRPIGGCGEGRPDFRQTRRIEVHRGRTERGSGVWQEPPPRPSDLRHATQANYRRSLRQRRVDASGGQTRVKAMRWKAMA